MKTLSGKIKPKAIVEGTGQRIKELGDVILNEPEQEIGAADKFLNNLNLSKFPQYDIK
jgi:hypothetical protein